MSRKGYDNLQDKPKYWPTKVKPKLELIEGWARNGLSNEQIALNLGVGESTFYSYMKEYPELVDALRTGREDAEIIVENALFKRACGYNFVEAVQERKRVYDEDGNWTGQYEMVTVKRTRKHVEGDVSAQKYWLEHRAPNRWERNPTPPVDMAAIQAQVQTLATLLSNPVPERQIGCEDEE